MSDGILSIQSHVAYGHVGNSAAVFPLQRLGHEVWPVNTVLFSNHTGYGAWRGRPVEVSWVEEVLTGIEERGAFPRVRAVLSGYLGTPELGVAVMGALSRIRIERPDALYACDPVMGDDGRGFFVRTGIPEMFRDRMVPRADIVTPNRFELAYLAGQPVDDLEQAIAAAAKLRATGPKIVVCTSLILPGEDGIAVLADTAQGSWLCRTPRLPVNLNGTGDAFTALFLAAWLRLGEVASALETVVASMYALIEATAASGSRELQLVQAQDAMVAPATWFEAGRVR